MTPLVATHVIAASTAALLGIGLFVMQKGTRAHRLAGRTWVATMAITALSSFGIHSLNPPHLSWVHALSLVSLVTITRAVLAARSGNALVHRRAIIGSYAGLLLAGISAFATPGRVLHTMLLG
jgi:uncharacterized membrane protein